MSTLKVEWVNDYAVNPTQGYCDEPVPVVRLEALRAWLEAHKYPLQYGEVNANSVINDLLAELKDLA